MAKRKLIDRTDLVGKTVRVTMFGGKKSVAFIVDKAYEGKFHNPNCPEWHEKQVLHVMGWTESGQAGNWIRTDCLASDVEIRGTVELVAKAFADLLREELGDEQFEEMRQRNVEESSPNICHSHDFCDANMVMIDALCEADFGHQDDCDARIDMMAEAWNYARIEGWI